MRRLLSLLLAALAPLPAFAAPGAARVATVLAVEPGRVADLVVLDSGFDGGLRQGMVCRLVRDGRDFGEILLVDLRPGHSVALLTRLDPGRSVRPGDAAQLKLLKS